MKKFGIFMLACACICASCLTKIEENPLYSFSAVERVCYVSKSEFEGADVLRSGDLFFNYFSAENASEELEEKSIAVQFELSCDLGEVLGILEATIVSVSESDDLVVICAWTKYGSDTFVVNEQVANIQIAVSDEKIIVGFPAIYTSF